MFEKIRLNLQGGPFWRRAFFCLLITSLIVLGVGYTKLYLSVNYQIHSPLLLFYAAIVLCTWIGGFLYGVLAMILSTVFSLNYFFPFAGVVGTFEDTWAARMIFFWIDCAIVILICSVLRRAMVRADQALKTLRETQKTLKRNESLFKKIFNSNMIGLVFSTNDGTIIEANQYFKEITGLFESSEDQPVNWRERIGLEKMQARAIEAGDPNFSQGPYEIGYICKNNKPVYLLVGAVRVDETSFISLVLNISDRKKYENELFELNHKLEQIIDLRTKQLQEKNTELERANTESEAAASELRASRLFLDSVIENIPNMIFVKDAKELRFVRFNKAGERLLGKSSSDLIGKNDYDFFPEEEAAHFTSKDRYVIEQRVVLDIPEETIHTEGGLRILHTKKLPLFDKNGVAQYLLGISEDITERKHAEAQRLELVHAKIARDEAEKSTAKLSLLSDVGAALNASLDIQMMIRSFAKVMVNNFASVCVVDIYDKQSLFFERYVVAGEIFGYAEMTTQRMPKSLCHCEWYSQPQVKNHLNAEHLRQIALDPVFADQILKHKISSVMTVPLSHHENAMGWLTFFGVEEGFAYDALDLSIAKDVAKRAALAIENAGLYLKANEANHAKSAFLANMSHEIRTPLGAILGFSEIILEQKELSDDVRNQIQTIQRNGQHLLRIVDEILDLSKIESNRISIEKVSFSLSKLVAEVYSSFSLVAREKKLNLQILPEGSVHDSLCADPFRLRQILNNILGNAIKFTEAGLIQMTYRLISVEGMVARLEFKISDTGIGLSEDQAKNLFRPFTQADDSMTRRFGGTGLGLYLSRQLARMMGGDVILNRSRLGEGSEFIISVLVEKSQVPDLDFSKSIRESVGQVRLSLSQPRDSAQEKKVLIVDDSADNRFLIKTFLSRMGIGADLVEDGKEAIKKVFLQDYAVVLMDIQMPEMDGFQTVAHLREHGYQKQVIALTAHAMKGDREKCLHQGFDDYLCKPLTSKALKECLRNHGFENL